MDAKRDISIKAVCFIDFGVPIRADLVLQCIALMLPGTRSKLSIKLVWVMIRVSRGIWDKYLVILQNFPNITSRPNSAWVHNYGVFTGPSMTNLMRLQLAIAVKY